MPKPLRTRNTTSGLDTSPPAPLKGPFRTKVSEKAEQLTFEMLTEDEKRVLATGFTFDPARYEVYRFFVVLESQLEAPQLSLLSNWSRRLKRQSLAKADRVFVRLRPKSRQVSFAGIHPTSRDRDGQTTLDLSGEFLFRLNVGVARLQIAGKAKDLVKRRKAEVIAARTDASAEWIFLRPYIDTTSDLRLQFCCLVPTDLPDAERVMRCEVDIMQGNRAIDERRKKVKFPRVS